MKSLFTALLGCSHERLTFPQTDRRTRSTTRACLECGAVFPYNWEEMRTGQPLAKSVLTPCPVMQARRAS